MCDRLLQICVMIFAVAAGCAPPSTDPLETNKELVRRFTAAANRNDAAALDEILAPGFIRHSQSTPEVDVRSVEDFKQFNDAGFATFPDGAAAITQMVAERDLVAFWGTYSGTQSGPMGPFPPSGRKMAVDMSGLFRIGEGRIAELWVVWDNMAVLGQLGLSPPQAMEAGS